MESAVESAAEAAPAQAAFETDGESGGEASAAVRPRTDVTYAEVADMLKLSPYVRLLLLGVVSAGAFMVLDQFETELRTLHLLRSSACPRRPAWAARCRPARAAHRAAAAGVCAQRCPRQCGTARCRPSRCSCASCRCCWRSWRCCHRAS